MLISIEGVDASATQELIESLLKVMKPERVVFMDVSQPSREAEEYRMTTQSRFESRRGQYLWTAACLLENQRQIQRHLDDGRVVLVRNYVDGQVARGVSHGLDYEWCRAVYEATIPPDQIFYLTDTDDLNPEVRDVLDREARDRTDITRVTYKQDAKQIVAEFIEPRLKNKRVKIYAN